MRKILIGGGRGLIGKKLQNRFTELNWEYSILSTNPESSGKNVYYWNPFKSEIDIKAFENVTDIVNLAGAGIADKRWSSKRKREILESRTKSTELLFRTVKENNIKIDTYVSASAVGIYGMNTTEKIYIESDSAAKDFLGKVTESWEQAANKFNELDIRTIMLRIGVVLSNNGGALAKMVLPVKYGLGAAFGKGTQYLPWIHIEDLANMFVFSLQNKELKGAYNAVAPGHVTNKQFMKIISSVLNRPFILPNIPAFILRTVLGEQAGLLLEGSRVSANKIIESGFKFRYENLEMALKDLLIIETK